MSVCASCGHAAASDFQFCPRCGTRAVGAATGGMIGRTLVGKYRILEQIGAGSMGTVYRAEHTALRRQVAIKILHRELQVDDEALHRFQREGIAAGHLQHPNAIQMFDFDRDDDRLFLAMEFVDGKSLRDVLRERGALAPAMALELGRQLLSVLEAAHDAGIVHRDLKPENLMLAAGDGEPVLKVLDFGLSKLVGRPLAASMLTHAGRVLGTPLYMAPEQWRGEDADHRADLHAAGLLLFEMLTGRPPFQARDVNEAMLCSTSRPVPALREVAPQLLLPAGVEELVQRALAKNRDDRWPSAAAMLAALEAIDPGRVQTGAAARRVRRRAAVPARKPAPRPAPRPRWPLVAAASGALALFAAAIFWWLPHAASAAGSPLLRERAVADRSAEENAYLDLLDAGAGELRRGNVDAALAVLGSALQRPCADPEGLLLRARALRARGQFDLAVADLDEAARRHEPWAPPLVERGWLELQRGQPDAAERAYAQALARDPQCAAALAGRAAVLRGRGKATQALALLDGVAPADREAAAVQVQRGLCELALGHADAAIPALVLARRADARDWQAPAGLGDAYAQKGDVPAAIQQYRDALAIEEVASTRGRLIEALAATGQLQAAEQALPPKDRDATQLGPAVRALAALDRDDAPAAAAALSGAGDADADRLCLLAALELQRGRAEPACAAAERALGQQDDHAVAHLVLGIGKHKLGDERAAAQYFAELCRLAPDDAFAQRACGILCMDWLLQPDAALRHFERCRQLGSDDGRLAKWIDRLRDEGADAARAPAPDAARPAAASAPAVPATGIRRAVQQALGKQADRLRASVDLKEDHDSWDKAWEARSRRFLVRTTHSYGLGMDLALGLEQMLDRVQQTLGTDRQPTRALPVFVFPTVAEYNAFGTQNGQEHSSFYASFFAAQHAERPVAVAFEPNATLLRVQVTHSMVHQYFADAFPQARLPTWIDEGLAAHFSLWWDYEWGRTELERLRADDKVPPLRTLMRDALPAYAKDTHPRFITLGMLFYWLLRYREDTATTADHAPFRDHVLALLRGDDGKELPCRKVLADVDKLDAEFRAFEFPR